VAIQDPAYPGRRPVAIEARTDVRTPGEHSGLLTAVDALPPTQREAVVLAYGAGLTNMRLSTVLGIPLGTAKSRLRIGLDKLRNSYRREDAVEHA
jgi:RNA polymerase sigma-70 factor (ECF subfamily)